MSAQHWIPDQPGAWVMALFPALAGLVVAGATPARLWLVVAWLLCYCVQFTWARWLKSRFQRRYLPPAAVYVTLLVVVGVPFLIVHPSVLIWAPCYVVLAAVSFWGAWVRKDRSLWSNAASVLATTMMAEVVFALDEYGSGQRPTGWILAVIFALTQFGSVLFVKTMMRERRSRGHLIASWAWHGALLLAAVVVSATVTASAAALAGAAAVLLLRAVAMPLLARNRTFKPIVVGMVEMVTSLLVFVVAVFCAPWLVM